MPRSRARRLNLNNDDLDLVENAKRAAARDDFAVYRRVIRREMLWDWWPQEVSEKLQQFYTRPESRATAQGGDHGPAGVGAPAGNVQPRAAEYLDVGVAAHDTLDFSIGALAQLVTARYAEYAALIEAEAMATDDAERGAIVGATAPSRRDKSRCRFSDPAA